MNAEGQNKATRIEKMRVSNRSTVAESDAFFTMPIIQTMLKVYG